MYTFLSFIGVMAALTVLGVIPFVVDKKTPAVAHPESEPEPSSTPSRASLPAPEEPAAERPSRNQKVHGQHPSQGAARTAASDSEDRSGSRESAEPQR